ncbi:hypothetical protein PCC7424_0099 [Gloeothece citriformis PCC 7424]|uniref:Lipoprotein n=1 Tax=Gloeothece citriformis (strain PCC 7424) TaxID=65393 RepID=B7K986_GLOC7|nr:hypothetical protein [Gloeothece citriformis]ACK68569.1 hypothetical protein PCC7424_0099 [Gloeothece citriformis PCC 7424]
MKKKILLFSLLLAFFNAHPSYGEIVNLEGDIQLLESPESVLNQESSELQIFVEKQNFILPQDIWTNVPVTIDVPLRWRGWFSQWMYRETNPIPRGTRVNSYYIYLNPVKIENVPRKELPVITATGTVTFSKPILGVIGWGEHLIETNPIFGLEGVEYSRVGNRLDAPNYWDMTKSDKAIIMDTEGKVLQIDFLSADGVDPIRVITKSD